MSYTAQTLSVAKGGTGRKSLTVHGVLIGATAGAVNVTSAGTAGQVLTSNGASVDPSFQNLPTVAPVGASYVTLSTDGTLTSERVLTGTASQIIVTDGGAGSTVTLSVGADLAAVAGIAGTGLAVRTGTGTWTQRSIQGTTDQIDVANTAGAAGNPTISLAANPVVPGNASITVPAGTVGQRPVSPQAGMLRHNDDTNQLEAYLSGSWVSIFASAGGGGILTLPIVFGDIATAGTTIDIPLVTIPTNTHLFAAAIETTTEGNNVATLQLSAGWFSSNDTIANYDGLQAAPNTATSTNGNIFLPIPRAIRLYAVSTGGNLNTLTQGRWVVRLAYVQY